MVLLANVRCLLGVSNHRQQVCERRLDKATRSLELVERDLYEFDQQVQGLTELLASYRTDDQRLSHPQFLMFMRRQAVIRRRIANLTVERAELIERRQGAAQDIQRLREMRKQMDKTHLKYQHLQQRLLKEQRSYQRRQEENDIEGLLVNFK